MQMNENDKNLICVDFNKANRSDNKWNSRNDLQFSLSILSHLRKIVKTFTHKFVLTQILWTPNKEIYSCAWLYDINTSYRFYLDFHRLRVASISRRTTGRNWTKFNQTQATVREISNDRRLFTWNRSEKAKTDYGISELDLS